MKSNKLKPEYVERLKDVYQIIAGIPKKRVDLGDYMYVPGAIFATQEVALHNCGSIGCIAGWLSVHPHYRHLVKNHITRYGEVYYLGYYAIAEYLGINHNDLFMGNYNPHYHDKRSSISFKHDAELKEQVEKVDKRKKINDKQYALYRILRLIGYTAPDACSRAMREGSV